MAATQILASGSTGLDSSDVTVTSALTVGLKGTIDQNARCIVSLKDDGNAYNVVDELNCTKPAIVIQGPGVYRFTRVAGSTFGVYSA